MQKILDELFLILEREVLEDLGGEVARQGAKDDDTARGWNVIQNLSHVSDFELDERPTERFKLTIRDHLLDFRLYGFTEHIGTFRGGFRGVG